MLQAGMGPLGPERPRFAISNKLNGYAVFEAGDHQRTSVAITQHFVDQCVQCFQEKMTIPIIRSTKLKFSLAPQFEINTSHEFR
jgi:hypothetical protein